MTEDELKEARNIRNRVIAGSWLKPMKNPDISAARYWEAQAEMWHENYKGLMAIEAEHRRFKEALERIAAGTPTGPRCQAIAKKALGQ